MNLCYNNDKRCWGKNEVISSGKKSVLFLVIFSLIFLFNSTSVYRTELSAACYDCSLWDVPQQNVWDGECKELVLQEAGKKIPHNPLPPTPPKKPKAQIKQTNKKPKRLS